MWLALAAHLAAADLLVYAAVSLSELLTLAAREFEAAHPGARVRLNLAASGALQIQIRQGAPADLFVSASPREMEALAARGKLDGASRRPLFMNELVLVAPSTSPLGPLRRAEELRVQPRARLAWGEPETVPAGRYTKEALLRAGLWEELAPRGIPAGSVRQVLAYVLRGEVDAGFVYRTDVLSTPGVKVLWALPPDARSPILYEAAVLRSAGEPLLAREFLALLSGPAGAALARRLGFRPLVNN